MTRLVEVSRDRGSAALEAPIAVGALFAVLMFVVGGVRLVNTNGAVNAAARAAARAAAIERSTDGSGDAAQAAAAASLSKTGAGCVGGPTTASNTSNGVVSVTVMCVVSLSDVVFAGFPGHRTVTATAVEHVDELRGGQ